MKTITFAKAGRAALLLALGMAGCTTMQPVREPPLYPGENRAERTIREPSGWDINGPTDRYFNAISRGWERPPPFGPRNALTPVP